MSSIPNSSRLEIILGCMFSGKTTELIRRTDRYRAIIKTVLLINHKIDTRCGEECIQTHDGKNRKAIKVERLCDLFGHPSYHEADVIGVDEAQFFDDLVDFVMQCELDGKVLIISGLDGDFKRRPFGKILECIPLCDEVTKLSALDRQDGTPAIFSKRIVNVDDQTLVGNNDTYVAVNRKHYFD